MKRVATRVRRHVLQRKSGPNRHVLSPTRGCLGAACETSSCAEQRCGPDEVSSSCLLDSFTEYVRDNRDALERALGVEIDNAHLLTARNLGGATIGLAWTGGMCDALGRSSAVEQSAFSSKAFVGTIVAHELGHNLRPPRWRSRASRPASRLRGPCAARPSTPAPRRRRRRRRRRTRSGRRHHHEGSRRMPGGSGCPGRWICRRRPLFFPSPRSNINNN